MTESLYDTLLATVRRHGTVLPPIANDEPTEEYLRRLTDAVSRLSKRLFDAMPDPAQAWFDDAATALAEATPIPLPDGFSREEATPDTSTIDQARATDPTSTKAPARSRAGAGTMIKATATENASTIEPAPRRIIRPTGSVLPVIPIMPRPMPPPIAAPGEDESVATRIARLIIADEGINLATLIRRLKGQQVATRDATVRQHRAMILMILRLVREAGWQPPAE